MNTIKRTHCVICTGDALELLGGWQNFPVHMGTTKTYNDMFADQLWSICKTCGCIQLQELIKYDILYNFEHHTPGSIGDTWTEYNAAFAKFIKESQDDLDKREYKVVEDLEHIYNVAEYFKNGGESQHVGDRVYVAFPTIDVFLKNGWTNGLNFQHTFLTTEDHIDFVLFRAGYSVVAKKRFNDCVMFVEYRKVNFSDIWRARPDEYDKNRELYHNYMNGLVTDAKVIGERLGEISGPRFMFGAHIFTQTLLYSGLNGGKFMCVLDNDTDKQGERLYGTGLYVESPEIIRNLEEPVVVVRAAQYTEEIAKGLHEINSSVIVI